MKKIAVKPYTYTTLTQSALDTTAEEIAKQMNAVSESVIFKVLQNSINQTLSIPPSVLMNSPPITEKYPITNPAYTEFIEKDDTPLSFSCPVMTALGLTITNFSSGTPHQAVFDALKNAGAFAKDVSLFVARLKYARCHDDSACPDKNGDDDGLLKNGHTYDPWYRDISNFNKVRYELLLCNGYATATEANHNNRLMLWLYGTTVAGTKINVLLYEPIAMSYVNKRRTKKHLDAIAPYSVYTETEYNLLVN